MRRQTVTINWSDELPLAQGIDFPSCKMWVPGALHHIGHCYPFQSPVSIKVRKRGVKKLT